MPTFFMATMTLFKSSHYQFQDFIGFTTPELSKQVQQPKLTELYDLSTGIKRKSWVDVEQTANSIHGNSKLLR